MDPVFFSALKLINTSCLLFGELFDFMFLSAHLTKTAEVLKSSICYNMIVYVIRL